MKDRDPSYIHPAFPQPDNVSISLWRYMDLDKFEWIVENNRLFMPSAKNLGDPFEGTTPRGELNWWQYKANNADSDKKRQIIQYNRSVISNFARQFRDQYYVSCWHMNEFENYAMWRCYTKTNDAVAIRTQYSTLRSLLSNHVEMGLVRYIDYAIDRLPSMNLFEYIMHKDTYYTYENEVRAVAASFISYAEWQKHFRENHFELSNKPGFLFYAPKIDICELIEGIIIHPESSLELKMKVDKLCKKAGIKHPVLSRIIKDPVF